MWEENKLYMDGHVVPGTLTRRAEFFYNSQKEGKNSGEGNVRCKKRNRSYKSKPCKDFQISRNILKVCCKTCFMF